MIRFNSNDPATFPKDGEIVLLIVLNGHRRKKQLLEDGWLMSDSVTIATFQSPEWNLHNPHPLAAWRLNDDGHHILTQGVTDSFISRSPGESLMRLDDDPECRYPSHPSPEDVEAKCLIYWMPLGSVAEAIVQDMKQQIRSISINKMIDFESGTRMFLQGMK